MQDGKRRPLVIVPKRLFSPLINAHSSSGLSKSITTSCGISDILAVGAFKSFLPLSSSSSSSTLPRIQVVDAHLPSSSG